MAGEIEAFGGMTTAGLAAHAIDRDRGAHGEAHGACLNCNTPLDGRFCRECGQPAHIHRTLGHVVEEFLHGVLHFDTKAWRTLPMLVFQPGKLTREYVHGRRARYIAPLALFLFTIFVMFFVFGMLGGPHIDDNVFRTETKAEAVAEARKELANAQAELRGAEAKLAAVRANPNAEPGDEGSASGDVAGAKAAVAVAQAALNRAEARPEDPARKTPEPETWQERLRQNVLSGEVTINTGNKEFDSRIRHALLNPDFTLYKMQQKAYKLSFLLVPMSLPFLWLLFPFRRSVTLYDHTVFALYSLSFMSLLFVAITLLSRGSGAAQTIASLLFFVPPVHMYAQLKGAYSLGWLGALWRTWWLLIFSQIVLGLYVTLIVSLGVLD